MPLLAKWNAEEEILFSSDPLGLFDPGKLVKEISLETRCSRVGRNMYSSATCWISASPSLEWEELCLPNSCCEHSVSVADVILPHPIYSALVYSFPRTLLSTLC